MTMMHHINGRYRIERRGRRPERLKLKRKMKRSKDVDVREVAAHMPHRREVQSQYRHDARAVDVLGRLRLNNFINEDQYQAACVLRVIVRKMRAVIDAPSPNAGAVPMDGLLRGSPAQLSAEYAARCMAQHKRVYDMLLIDCGVRVTRIVTRTVIYEDNIANEEDRDLLVVGLKRLARYFKLGDPRQDVPAIVSWQA